MHVSLYPDAVAQWAWATYRMARGWVADQVGAAASLYYGYGPYKAFMVLNIYFLFSVVVSKPPADCLVEPTTAHDAGIAFSLRPHGAARKNKDSVSVL
ncbi:hypothetical protein [Komagataeibacter xylinus]|uniref:hypothetical protein n=1 Tax=Komagataeibacter xylinus TaxID=28448 RepID=UPI00132F51E0|nr:hypothetical protein [Komagataeibacter xylinus]